MALNANSFLVSSHGGGGRAVLRFVGSGTITVTGNSTVNSDIAGTQYANDQILGASITGMWWSISGNTITVARGANTIGTLSGTGQFDRTSGWPSEVEYPAANVAITFGSGGAGVLYLELTKQYTGGNPPDPLAH